MSLLTEINENGVFIILTKRSSTPLILSQRKFIEIFQIKDQNGFLNQVNIDWNEKKAEGYCIYEFGEFLIRYTKTLINALVYQQIGNAKIEL
jgi:hypothetical protein